MHWGYLSTIPTHLEGKPFTDSLNVLGQLLFEYHPTASYRGGELEILTVE